MKSLLLITDLPAGRQDSAVDHIFGPELRRHYEVDTVYLDRALHRAERRDGVIVVPGGRRWETLANRLRPVVDIATRDFVVVRNKYHVLRQVLAWPRIGRVGFWETFPHSYRRLEEARLEGRSVWRKRLEYSWRHWRETALLRRVDFYLPITAHHRRAFFPDLPVPGIPLPMGVEDSVFAQVFERPEAGPLRFVYIGTVDALRRLEVVNAAFVATPGDFTVDYYTFSQGPSVAALENCGDPRIRVRAALPPAALFDTIARAHAGVAFIPETRTYLGASPTKTLEYGALGLAILANPLPDYEGWLDPSCAFLAPFDPVRIREQVNRILATPRPHLQAMGRLCRDRVRARRSYSVLARQLREFLESL